MNHTCLFLPSRSWYSFTDPGEMKGWVDLGWLVGYIPNPDAVAHLSTNRARRRLTLVDWSQHANHYARPPEPDHTDHTVLLNATVLCIVHLILLYEFCCFSRNANAVVAEVSSHVSSSSSSLKFLEWPKQQRHHEDRYRQSKYEQYQTSVVTATE